MTGLTNIALSCVPLIVGLILAVAATAYTRWHKEDARLVAAAPDLLAALQPFASCLSSEETTTITVRSDFIRAARAAIAKAESRRERQSWMAHVRSIGGKS